MDFIYYQAAARRTMQTDVMNKKQLLTMGVMGLCGEAGEVIDTVKKHLFQGHELDRRKVVEELGDVLWYLAACSEAIGVNLGAIAATNIDKLKNRYPDGFDTIKSIERGTKDTTSSA